MLFIGHGNPMNAIEENRFVQGWRKTIQSVPIPQAILCISAHWETKGTFVTAMPQPKTIHDFGGFPKQLFDTQYPAKGSPELAKLTQEIVKSVPVKLDHDWGLDHGSWSVLNVLYPKANIPVIQMSLDYSQSGQFHFNLAKELKSLREKGVLIIGSGNMVHNLGRIDWQNPNGGFDWANEANEGFKKMILAEEYSKLARITEISSAFKLAVPTPEHYNPLLYILGLKEKSEQIAFFNDNTVMGSLSMTSIKVE